MPNVYPFTFVVTKNLRQALAPVPGIPVYIFRSGTAQQRQLYADATANAGTEITQPLITDTNGEVSFFCPPGRVRIDAVLDSVTTQSTEELIVDNDSAVLLTMNETPQGLKNNSNVDFTVAETVLGERAALYVNGVRWAKVPNTATPSTNEFRVSGNTLVLGAAPGPGDVLLVDYYPVPS